MTITFQSLSWLCFAWCGFYIVSSWRTAARVGRQHYKRKIFLEFQPWRARDKTELAQARKQRRMLLCSFAALLLGIAARFALLLVQ